MILKYVQSKKEAAKKWMGKQKLSKKVQSKKESSYKMGVKAEIKQNRSKSQKANRNMQSGKRYREKGNP